MLVLIFKNFAFYNLIGDMCVCVCVCVLMSLGVLKLNLFEDHTYITDEFKWWFNPNDIYSYCITLMNNYKVGVIDLCRIQAQALLVERLWKKILTGYQLKPVSSHFLSPHQCRAVLLKKESYGH